MPRLKDLSAELLNEGKTLRITADGESAEYALTKLEPHPGVARHAWRIGKYDVAMNARGWCWCDCPASTACDHEKACRHIRAAKLVGLLPRRGKQ